MVSESGGGGAGEESVVTDLLGSNAPLHLLNIPEIIKVLSIVIICRLM